MNLNFENFAHTTLMLLNRSTTLVPDGPEVTVKLKNYRVATIREDSNVLSIEDVDGKSYDFRLYDPSFPTLPLAYDKVNLATTTRWASLVAEYLNVVERGCYLGLLGAYGPRSTKSLFVHPTLSPADIFASLPAYCEAQVTWTADGETKQVSGVVRGRAIDGIRRVTATFEFMVPVADVLFVTVLSEYRVSFDEPLYNQKVT